MRSIFMLIACIFMASTTNAQVDSKNYIATDYTQINGMYEGKCFLNPDFSPAPLELEVQMQVDILSLGTHNPQKRVSLIEGVKEGSFFLPDEYSQATTVKFTDDYNNSSFVVNNEITLNLLSEFKNPVSDSAYELFVMDSEETLASVYVYAIRGMVSAEPIHAKFRTGQNVKAFDVYAILIEDGEQVVLKESFRAVSDNPKYNQISQKCRYTKVQ